MYVCMCVQSPYSLGALWNFHSEAPDMEGLWETSIVKHPCFCSKKDQNVYACVYEAPKCFAKAP